MWIESYPQFSDSRGNPLSSGTLTFYSAGTSSLLTVYSDVGLVTPIANPQTLTSAGRPATQIFMQAASYKMIVKDSTGAVIVTADNIANPTYLAQLVAAPVTNTITLTGTQNDLALTGASAYAPTLVRLSNASSLTITGVGPGVAGQIVRFVSVGAGDVFFTHQSAGSSAADRLINFATTGTTPLAAGVGWAEFQYDGTTARWRMIAHEQGAALAFVPSTSAATGAWTVDNPGDISSSRYFLRGRQLTVTFGYLNTTTSLATATIAFTVPNGYTTAFGALTMMRGLENVTEVRAMVYTSGGTTLTLQRQDSTNWSALTNQLSVQGEIVVEVQ
jgi:hypothetical protein